MFWYDPGSSAEICVGVKHGWDDCFQLISQLVNEAHLTKTPHFVLNFGHSWHHQRLVKSSHRFDIRMINILDVERLCLNRTLARLAASEGRPTFP